LLGFNNRWFGDGKNRFQLEKVSYAYTMGQLPFFQMHRFSTRLVLGLVALILATTLSAGVPAYLLTRTQLERQAEDQVETIRHATLSLLQAEQNRLNNLALLFTERPTFERLLTQQAWDELPTFLAAFQRQSALDLLVFCAADGTVWTAEGQLDQCPHLQAQGITTVAEQPALLASALFSLSDDQPPLGVAVAGRWLDEYFLGELTAATGATQSIVALNGRRLTSSQRAPVGTIAFTTPPAEQIVARLTLGEHTYFARYLPLSDPSGATIYYAEIALPVDDLISTENRALLILIASTGLVALLGTLLAAWYIQRITHPLEQLTGIAHEIAQGNFIATIPSFSGPIEVTTLANALQHSHGTMRRTLTELAQARDWLDHLIQSIVEGVIIFDHQGRITLLSQGAELLSGWSSREAIGHSIDELFPIADEVPNGFRAMLPPNGQKRRVEVVNRSGQKLMLAITGAQLTPIQGAQPQTALVLRDVTEEEASQKLHSYFLANITHEFRTPLSTLSASLELLLAEADTLSPDELRELLKPTYLSLLSLQMLINNLLEGSRIEAGRFVSNLQRIDLRVVIDEAIRIVQPFLERRHHQLNVHGLTDSGIVEADGPQLTQVLVNLLTNAAKYNPLNATIDLHVAQMGDQVRISVSDRGPGIPESERTNLFRQFVRAHDQAAEQYGIGLGLYVVKTTVEAHGGQVGVNARPGGGSIFWLELPRKQRGKA
jgi:PAS domain S-box-containing protein